MPQGWSCCLQCHTAPARLASAKAAHPASEGLPPVEPVTGHCDATTTSPDLPHCAGRQETEAAVVFLHAHICLPNVPQVHLITKLQSHLESHYKGIGK